MDEKATLAERRASLLQAGAQVSRNIISILDLDELLQKTVDLICKEFDFYYAGVFLIDETGEWAVLESGHGEAGQAMIEEGHRLKVGGLSMIGASTSRKKALIALDVGEEPVHFKNPHLPLTRSEMALPLVVGDEIIGALTVQSIEEAAFSEDDITALQAMADQLAIAIDNARLYTRYGEVVEQARRRARLLEAAAEVGRDVTSILDLDRLLNRTVDVICDAYGFYYAGVFLLDDEEEWAVLRAGHGEAGQEMLEAAHKLRVGGLSMIGTSIAERKARIALDVGEEAVHFKNPHLPLTRSEMALPLVVGAEVIGAVTVQSTEEAAFSSEDISSLQAMADQLAVALRNAQLLQELEEAHAELLRTKTYEAIASATTEAIHWIGNKALPITVSVQRMKEDLQAADIPEEILDSMREDLTLIDDSACLIVDVKEHLIGPAREHKPAPTMVEDVIKDAALERDIPDEIINFSVPSQLPRAVADPVQLIRAFRYVLQNAIEATEEVENPRIEVELAPVEHQGILYVRARIADNGPGLPEDRMDKIWAAFYTTKGVKHAGLGLSACLQILKQIDGQIIANNRPEGGAVFDILIPVFTGKDQPATFPMAKSILLVDDEDPWSSFVEDILMKAGNTVARVSGGQADFGVFDIILVDDILEETDSTAIIKKISKSGMGKKTIVVSSDLRVERTTEIIRYGVMDMFVKPYTKAGLARLLS
ncbi:MAG: GAF domain-containing protein [Anaerolineales bacterium]